MSYEVETFRFRQQCYLLAPYFPQSYSRSPKLPNPVHKHRPYLESRSFVTPGAEGVGVETIYSLLNMDYLVSVILT
jgi:hypothetical protein